jgi:predicted CXXCH cytochrome family protein
MKKDGFVKMVFWIFFLIFFCAAQESGAGVIGRTGHGDLSSGIARNAGIRKGSCNQCHNEGHVRSKYPRGLMRDNDNELCYSCHRDESPSGVFPGQKIYDSSTHKIDSRFVWPGTVAASRREMAAAGKCINCHNPHGVKDRTGLIPSLMIEREEGMCLACHDGNPSAKDVAREILKPYSHRVVRGSGKHSADEAGNPNKFSYMGGNRHAECGDCHNAHALAGDFAGRIAPAASLRNSRVSRIRVSNGAAGTVPRYEYRPAGDISTQLLEYEICFKCHSSWTVQPPGQQDMAVLFNTNNASFHPVEGQGKNLGIDPKAFVAGINAFSMIYCTDCHGSDEPRIRGPHGSQFQKILRRPYESRSVKRAVSRDELCFLCHNFDVYANPLSVPFVKRASRFNAPASPNGHAFHVGRQNFACNACHESHGSPRFGALITIGKSPGLLSFSMSPNGGSCSATCHSARSYSINYPR